MIFFSWLVPSVPRRFTLLSNSSSTLVATWQEPEASNGILLGYNIYCLTYGGLNLSFTAITSELSALIDNLMPFTNYTCEVRASTLVGESAPSNTDMARTDESGRHFPTLECIVIIFWMCCIVPGVPRSIQAEVNGSRSISITWLEPEQPNGVIVSYVITIRIGSIVIRNASISSTTTYFVAFKLDPFTVYTFEVTAMTSVGPGNSNTVIARTDEEGRLLCESNGTSFLFLTCVIIFIV